MPEPLKIGMIGLDTSHVVAFARLLNDPGQQYHVAGGRVAVAFPGGSPDFALSASRVEGFTRELRDSYGVAIVDSPQAVAEQCEAVLLTSVDGRVHREQFEAIAPFARPTFIDKPFAVSSTDAQAMGDLARRHGVPLMSCSSLRWAQSLTDVLNDARPGAVIGADCHGPMALEPTQPGLFWYGIHAVEMLFAVLGPGCRQVTATASDDHDLVVGLWGDGRIGTVRGNRKGNNGFGALVHRSEGTQFADVKAHPKPPYASLLEQVLSLFATGKSPVDLEETLQIVRFIEAANRSRDTGQAVTLDR